VGSAGAEVVAAGNRLRYTFQGDSWMRRTATEDGTTTNYLYDGDSLLAEYDNTLALTAHHAGSGLDRTLWTVRGGNLQTPLSSAQNVMAVADGTGNITARYRYTAFGERYNLLGGDPSRKDPSFQNRNYDSGLGIYDYRNRSFDPTTGRFLQTDPVDGDNLMNPYTFPGNNPVTNMDPMGTDWRWNATAQEWVEVRGPGLYHSPRPLRKGEFPGEYIRSKHWAEYRELPYSEALIAKYEARAGWWGRNIWENEWAEEVRWMGIQNAQWRLRKEGQAPISPEAFALAVQQGVAGAAADVAEPVLAAGDLTTNTAAVVFRWPENGTSLCIAKKRHISSIHQNPAAKPRDPECYCLFPCRPASRGWMQRWIVFGVSIRTMLHMNKVWPNMRTKLGLASG